jgi:IS5 family transposase
MRPVRGSCWTARIIFDSLNPNDGLRWTMSRRQIGHESFGFAVDGGGRRSSLDDLSRLIDWAPIARRLGVISCAAKGERAWPPLALFKAMLISVWYDLSDVKLADALDNRTSFRRFCGFSASEPTPERTAFVRFRKALVAHELDKPLFQEITGQLKVRAIKVKTGTLVDATIIASARETATRIGSSTRASQPFMASRLMSAPTLRRRLWNRSPWPRPISTTARLAPRCCRTIPARSSRTAPIGEAISAMPSAPEAVAHALSLPACGRATRPKHWRALTPGTGPFTG